jgi:hypothetical protein
MLVSQRSYRDGSLLTDNNWTAGSYNFHLLLNPFKSETNQTEMGPRREGESARLNIQKKNPAREKTFLTNRS